ncbi:hypothetical protein V1514DRAFT_369286 [Lipomyces japonicus]|uniref:uncharacterized protein n=1 Tax=Lipomyces japonicus TaxID=56871 RepID=UPI0034CF3CBE
MRASLKMDIGSPTQFFAHAPPFYPAAMQQGMLPQAFSASTQSHHATSHGGMVSTDMRHAGYGSLGPSGHATSASGPSGPHYHHPHQLSHQSAAVTGGTATTTATYLPQAGPIPATMYPAGMAMPFYYAGYSAPHMTPMEIYSANPARPHQIQLMTAAGAAPPHATQFNADHGQGYRQPPFTSHNRRFDRRAGLENKIAHRSSNSKNSSGANINYKQRQNDGKFNNSLRTVQINKAQVSSNDHVTKPEPGVKPVSPVSPASPAHEEPNSMEPTGTNTTTEAAATTTDNAESPGSPIPLAIAPVSHGPLLFNLKDALKNPRNTTNVYIRGLSPNTTDDGLVRIVSRFGSLNTAKAMMDNSTSLCKGFGFAEFATEEEAIRCIVGLAQFGYQTSFAKQSFALRLKELQDQESTNIYFSNIPRSWDKTELRDLLAGYEVVSLKVLRDGHGNNRGVGFARFPNREIAEEIIENFNGKPIGEGRTSMQVRFSDTEAQKKLKQVTVKKRNWRAHEYHLLAAQRALQELSFSESRQFFKAPPPLYYAPELVDYSTVSFSDDTVDPYKMVYWQDNESQYTDKENSTTGSENVPDEEDTYSSSEI